MMFTAPMTQLFAIALEKDSKPVTEALLREGVMQFISVSELEAIKKKVPSVVGEEVRLESISDIRKRVEGFLHTSGIIPSIPKESDLSHRVSVDLEKETKHLNKIDAERERLRERQRVLQQEVIRIEDLKRQVEIYGVNLSGTTIPSTKSFINIQTGKLSISKLQNLEDGLKGLPAVHVSLGQENDTVYQLLISTKRDSEQIKKILSSVGWTKVELSSELLSDKSNLFEEIEARLKKITDEQKKLQSQIEELIKSEEEYLKELWVNLRINELCSKIKNNFQTSSRTVIFAGWLPSDKVQSLQTRISQATQNRCYMEWHEADSDETVSGEVPVVFQNPKILHPFQLLVSNFGIPQYGTMDPTPFVMPIYLAMFGLMFPDVGQGFVLAALGFLGIFSLRNKEEKQSHYQISWLVLWCGISAILFGVVFGSYFGVSLFKPLWFNFHGIVSGHSSGSTVVESISDILLISLYFGISVIVLGLAFNWINLIRTGKWMELVFDKGGILGAWMYLGGIYIGYYMVSHDYKGLPSQGLLFLLAGVPALLLFLKEPYHHMKHSERQSGTKENLLSLLLNFLMHWIVELLEIFSGYLSNTLSFMRVAGLGIAHACLMIAFFTLADMAAGVFGWLILIIGNIMVIALEGISAGIQALRLNYYEFFTKFFHGTGKLHTPISLNSKL